MLIQQTRAMLGDTTKRRTRQMDQARQDHHGGTNDPDHLGHKEVCAEVEPPAEADKRELEYDEPDAPCEQEPADLAGGRPGWVP